MPLPSQTSPAPRKDTGTFRILTICTGNICRSPQAEQLLRARIPLALDMGRRDALQVASAGTLGYDGRSMDEQAVAEAIRLGIPDTGAHRARRIGAAHVEEADLILGLSREHRSSAVSLSPRATARTFTLVEFARTVEALADGRLGIEVEPLGADGFSAFMHRVVAAAAVARGQIPPPGTPDSLDIVDPFRQTSALYRVSADLIDDAVQRLTQALAALAEGRR